MELNVDEALRYLGIGGQAAESIRASVAAVADKLTAAIQPRYTYRMCSLQKTEAGFLLPEAELVLPGADAAKMLEQCDQAVLMACTLGTQFEALLRREQARDMSRAVILAACGSAWVEAGCDAAEKEIAALFPGKYLTDRFSPGYGDFSIEHQRDFSRLLDTPRKIGLTVTESCLLAPIKSVTAVIGLSPEKQDCHRKGCEECGKTDCNFRR